jgi:hypothetical protein
MKVKKEDILMKMIVIVKTKIKSTKYLSDKIIMMLRMITKKKKMKINKKKIKKASKKKIKTMKRTKRKKTRRKKKMKKMIKKWVK